MKPVYESSPIKRVRRTRDAMAALKLTVVRVLEEIQPATVRQTYYQLVSRGAIEKTEQQYKAVVRLLTQLRRARVIPFHWIADNTRWMRKPETHSGIKQLLRDTARTYRRSIWDSQNDYVEVWLEKDALSGVLYKVTAEFDVPLMVTRGYPSITFLQSAAEDMGRQEKPVFIYYFGDRDPSGVDIPRKVEAGLREFAPNAQISFETVAVTGEQVEAWNLPTRPTKRSDSRSKNFRGESVEVDAIPPGQLRQLVRQCIEQHIDRRALGVLQKTEASEREWLERLAKRSA